MKLGRDCIRDWGSRGAIRGLSAPLRYFHTWICPFPMTCRLHSTQSGTQHEDLIAPKYVCGHGGLCGEVCHEYGHLPCRCSRRGMRTFCKSSLAELQRLEPCSRWPPSLARASRTAQAAKSVGLQLHLQTPLLADVTLVTLNTRCDLIHLPTPHLRHQPTIGAGVILPGCSSPLHVLAPSHVYRISWIPGCLLAYSQHSLSNTYDVASSVPC